MRKGESEGSVLGLDFSEFHVGESWHAILEFHGESISRNDGRAVFENFCQRSGVNAVVGIVRHPNLKKAFPLMSNRATAVDEILFRKRDFSDVEVRRGPFRHREE